MKECLPVQERISASDWPVKRPVRGDLLACLPVFARIAPWKRPRKGKSGHFYQPKEGLEEFRFWLKGFDKLGLAEPVIIDSYFFFKKTSEKQTEFPIANHFGDEDNLRKSMNDCLVEAGILKDDRFVVGGEQFKQFANEDYVVLKIYTAKETM